jgi:hypothetical protein
LREALQVKQKHKTMGKALDLQKDQICYSGGVFWSPKKVKDGRIRRRVNGRFKVEERVEKVRTKKEREEMFL